MSLSHPPRLAERLLARAIASEPRADAILGDLQEEFAGKGNASGRAAALWYWAHAIRLATRYAGVRAADRLTRGEPPAPLPPSPGDSMMRTIAMEIRYAVRALRKRPLPSAIVVLTLALCLGANAAIFAIVDALVIRPFHFPDTDRIVSVTQTHPNSDWRRGTVAPANFLDWRRQATTVQQLSGFAWWDVNLVGRDEPERVQGQLVSADFFRVLGVQPLHGRSFGRDEETIGNHRRAVLGHGLWQRRFGADPALVGKTINLNGELYDVIGIAPAGFDFPVGSEVWAPLAFDAKTAEQRDRRYLTVIGRLGPGRALEDAQAEMATIAHRLRQQYPDDNRDRGARVFTLTQGMMDEGLGPILSMWQASALFVLLIGCANVANLLLARASERERELAVRLAIGASRAQVVRQLLIESVILGLVAVPGALLAAHGGLKVLVSYMPAKIARFLPGWHDVDVDARLLAVTVALAFGTAVVFGLLPALHSTRPRIAEALKAGGRTMSGGRSRLRRSLAIAEVALALPLLVAAGLSAIGVNRFLNGPQGYNPDGVLTMRAVLSEGRHPDAAAWRQFTEEAIERLAATPGAQVAAAANIIPAIAIGAQREFDVDGTPLPEPGRRPVAEYRLVTPRIFDALQVPVVSGRSFSNVDRDGTQPVAIVSESLARRHWPNVDPVGRRLRVVDGEWLTIVGVCGDVVQDWFDTRNKPTLYRPYAQAPTGYVALLVRTSGDPKHLVDDAIKAIAAVDPMQPVFEVLTFRELLRERTLGLQYLAAIMTTFGLFALVLAIVGVYSVMAYLVTQRTHEIGVRMALGATRSDVLKLTIGQAGRLTVIGVVIGAALAVALDRLIEAGLLGVVANDYRMVAGFGAILVVSALVAGYLPARRAAAIDPVGALRSE